MSEAPVRREPPPGASPEDARGQRLVRESAGVFIRRGRGIADISGKTDVGAFLDGLLSSPVKSLAVGEGQPSCLLNARGRLLAAFHLHALPGGTYRIALREPLREAAASSLAKYAFLSDIAVEDRSLEIAVLSVEGPASSRVLRLAGMEGEPPDRPHAFRDLSIAGIAATVVRGGETPEGGFDLWVPRESLERAHEELARAAAAAGGGLAGEGAAEVLRIEAGIARQGADYGDDAFPNEVGWEHALTYDKCYVGQEVVARMRTYGHANRRLVGLLFEPGATPSPGARILAEGGAEAGTLTSAALSDRLGRGIALGMIHRRAWGARSLRVVEEGREREALVVDLPIVRLPGGPGGPGGPDAGGSVPPGG